jgi:carbonic anhydrase
MSCTAPINIIRKEAGQCSLKCLLWYNYGNSSCTVTNQADSLLIRYDGSSDVMFNSLKYAPEEIRIYKPSIHTFDGQYADAEMVITHNSDNGGLLVCIPIMSNTNANASTGTNLLDDIITHAPKQKESTTLNINDFNLNFLIPKSAYYSYTGTIPYGTCGGQYQYVVFPKQSIQIQKATLDALGGLIHDSYIGVHPGQCYYNEKGTTQNGFSGDGQIYIDCQPTGEEDEIIYKESVPSKPMNMDWMYVAMYFILGFLFIYAMVKGMTKIFEYIGRTDGTQVDPNSAQG